MSVVSGVVTMTASTTMVVTPLQPPPLVDQIIALSGQDPALLGAMGYMDDVFTTRLVGDIN
jgi:hypothetical protein